MKNIEKLAIDHIVDNIKKDHNTKVEELNAAKSAIQFAKDNFTNLAKSVIIDIKDSAKEIEDEISEEGVTYFDTEISLHFGFPFKLK